MPFAFSGAARDGDLYEFTVEGSVYEKYEIELYFDSAADSAVNQDYDNTQLNFSVSAEKAGDGIDLTGSGEHRLDLLRRRAGDGSRPQKRRRGLILFPVRL